MKYYIGVKVCSRVRNSGSIDFQSNSKFYNICSATYPLGVSSN
jgi:hypothetical protein